jgi:hypothetical protein
LKDIETLALASNLNIIDSKILNGLMVEMKPLN